MPAADAAFVKQAAGSGVAEVQAGQLAATKAQDAKVKQFAQRMVTDHTATNQQLTSIAHNKGLSPPTSPDPNDAQAMEKLKGQSGAQFDRGYIRDQVTAHQEAVRLFQNEAQNGKDSAVKQFAQETLPKLQEHLRIAQGLERQ